MEIKITKLNEKCRIPSRAHYNDAGMDCYAMEDVTLPAMSYYLDGKVTTHPVMIPLGFNIEVPDGYMAVIKPRSSFNVKGIYTGIGTCDSGYRGEYKAVLMNLTGEDIEIKAGDRICQIVIEPVVIAHLTEDLGDQRNSGGFGSSGK